MVIREHSLATMSHTGEEEEDIVKDYLLLVIIPNYFLLCKNH